MTAETYRIKLIKKASIIAIAGNAVLAILKISVGYYSGSLSVIGDGVDSSADIILSMATFFAATIIAMPPDKKHPYGHRRAETLATTILSFVIFFAGIQLLYSSVLKIFSDEVFSLPHELAIYVTSFSIFGKLFLSLILNSYGKKANSTMTIANAKNMQADILISIGVLAGLFITYLFKNPIIDSIIALIVGLWIIKTGLGIFRDMNTELMDGSSDIEIYEKIFKAVELVDGAFNPHRVRVRKLADMYVMDLDVEVDPLLTVLESHKIASDVENSIRDLIEDVYDIVVHIEPIGNVENEKYGLSIDDVGGDFE